MIFSSIIEMFDSISFNISTAKLCSKENLRESSALNLWNLGCPVYDFYEKSKIF